MDISAATDRREMLFELLRQGNASDAAANRMTPDEQAERDAREARRFLARALGSWTMPRLDEDETGEDAAPAPAGSAAKSGGDHEFLGTVRP